MSDLHEWRAFERERRQRGWPWYVYTLLPVAVAVDVYFRVTDWWMYSRPGRVRR